MKRNYYFHIIQVCFLLFVLSSQYVVECKKRKLVETCKIIEKCIKCSNKQDDGCRETGHRVKVRCVDNINNITANDGKVVESPEKIMDEVKFTEKYRSCGSDTLDTDESWYFFVFQFVCFVIFLFAAKHVYQKKQHHYKTLAQSRIG